MRRALLTCSVTALVLVSCSGGAEETASSGSTTLAASATQTASSGGPASGSTGSDPATPAPRATAFGPATLVEGEAACSIDMGDYTTTSDGTAQHRDGNVTCTLTTNDPRVSGHEVDRWNGDRWSEGGTALIQWGSSRIRNQGGTWVGRFTGMYTDLTQDTITYWYRGTGDYAGLSFYLAITQPPSGYTWPVHGLISPGTPAPR